MTNEKIKFVLQLTNNRKFRACGLEEPISVEGRDIADLKRNLRLAVRNRFGSERPVSLLVGAALPVSRTLPVRAALAVP